MSANKCNFFYYTIRIYEKKALIFVSTNNKTTITMKTTIIDLVRFQTKKTIFFKAEAFTKLFFYAGYESTVTAIESYLNELAEQGLVEIKNIDNAVMYCAK